MSRIGKASISIPSGVTINVGKNNEVTVKGPKGELKQTFDGDMQFEIEEGNVTVKRPTEQIRHKAIHGLSRALLQNMVTGVTEGFKKTMELVGVGYRATITGQELDLALGFSHNIILQLPKEVAATTTAEKGKNPTITLESIDKQLLGQVAAKIRSFRKPEPYKGKGIRFAGEEVRRKAGKTAGK
jgi:large subunit ribosomal protein L6